MMRVSAILATLGWLAACAGDGDGAAAPPVPVPPVKAAFSATAAATIEVVVRDRQPVDTVELVAPDGRIVPARRIDREKLTTAPQAGGGFGLGVGVFGGSSTRVGTRFGIGIPLGGVEPPPELPEYRSLALVPVEDMTAYRAGWQRWSLRIRLGTPETSFRTIEIAAPHPPDG